MSIGLTSDLLYSQLKSNNSDTNASKLQNSLAELHSGDASDEEMLEVCKEFEAYLMEKVMKQMKETMTDGDEEENEYMSYFGDMMYQEYAKTIAENGELGLAQQLYESMKRNTVTDIKSVTQTTEAAAGAAVAQKAEE